MKKQYISPALDKYLMEVEAGIALSGVYEDILIEDGGDAGLLDENIW